MKLNIEFKPVRVTGRDKCEVLSKISGTRFSYMSTLNGSYMCNSWAALENKTVRVYSLEKRRKRVKRIMDNNKTLRSEIISPDHWIGHYYDIPHSVIKALNLRVEQGARTFKITPMGR